MVPVGSLAGIAGIIESVGGVLLLLGLFTRPVAFLVAGEMAIAYSTGTHRMASARAERRAPAVLFCFIWLYLS